MDSIIEAMPRANFTGSTIGHPLIRCKACSTRLKRWPWEHPIADDLYTFIVINKYYSDPATAEYFKGFFPG